MSDVSVSSLDRLALSVIDGGIETDDIAPFEGVCPRCGEIFWSAETLERHQNIKGHYRCEACQMNFQDGDALAVHKFQDHAADQDLTCPGCAKNFTRAGSIMQHVENHACPVITPEILNRRRNEIIEFHEALRKLNPSNVDDADDWSQYIKDGGEKDDFNDGARPHTRPDQSHKIYVRKEDFPALGQEVANYRSGNAKTLDLLTGDDLNPRQSAMAVQSGNVWAQTKDLFPDAPTKAQPTTAQMNIYPARDTLNRPENTRGRIIDPVQPGYNAAVFYNSILKKFKCPHQFCGFKHPGARGLTNHLNSSVHKPTMKIVCPCCNHTFHTMTATISHCESSHVHCKIKDGKEFRDFISQVSGGFLDALNHIKDQIAPGTPLFFIPEDFKKKLPYVAVRDEGRGSNVEASGGVASWT